MKKFSFLFSFLLLFFTACNSTQSSSNEVKNETKICPQCNMEVGKSSEYSSSLSTNGKTYYFDDIGCMILWANEHEIKKAKMNVFSKDTLRFIDVKNANYTIGETTPMSYGFCAYENKKKIQITFEEVNVKMLRGENMTNPKIRKQILGNK
ncbi:hypothetical protein [Sulfurimonas sp.]|uniref:hypothetical protein n=1 Tax=Sulfurimonas sp. TaxID=2022749 RepID=UPI002B46A81F|nr:hypothetical protein [Sulfurimonas sp.]